MLTIYHLMLIVWNRRWSLRQTTRHWENIMASRPLSTRELTILSNKKREWHSFSDERSRRLMATVECLKEIINDMNERMRSDEDTRVDLGKALDLLSGFPFNLTRIKEIRALLRKHGRIKG